MNKKIASTCILAAAAVALLFALAPPGGLLPGAPRAGVHKAATYGRAENRAGKTTGRSRAPSDLHPVRVAVFGGSIAAGWVDPRGGGYIRRALRSLTQTTGISYEIVRNAVPGMSAGALKGRFLEILRTLRPAVVVLSWGGLDDAVKKTPVPVFAAIVERQIAESLSVRAAVLLVTPPVTAAAYIDGRHAIPYLYFQAEMQVARAFHNPNVQVCDVYDQMWQYMRQHGESYQPFAANGWHPNAAGHKLAGHFLFRDLLADYGGGPIGYRAP